MKRRDFFRSLWAAPAAVLATGNFDAVRKALYEQLWRDGKFPIPPETVAEALFPVGIAGLNITLPESFLTRYLSAIERLATAAERIAGPVVVPAPPEPFAPTLWMESSNAQSRQVELEEAQEVAGFGHSYQTEIERFAPAHHRDFAGGE